MRQLVCASIYHGILSKRGRRASNNNATVMSEIALDRLIKGDGEPVAVHDATLSLRSLEFVMPGPGGSGNTMRRMIGSLPCH